MIFTRRILAALAVVAWAWTITASAATLDRAVCSAADMATDADPTHCSGTEIITSSTQEINHLYDICLLYTSDAADE